MPAVLFNLVFSKEAVADAPPAVGVRGPRGLRAFPTSGAGAPELSPQVDVQGTISPRGSGRRLPVRTHSPPQTPLCLLCPSQGT